MEERQKGGQRGLYSTSLPIPASCPNCVTHVLHQGMEKKVCLNGRKSVSERKKRKTTKTRKKRKTRKIKKTRKKRKKREKRCLYPCRVLMELSHVETLEKEKKKEKEKNVSVARG